MAAYHLDAGNLEMGWSHLFRELRMVGNVRAAFTESRSFAFRKEPKLYRGVFRKSSEGAVSLAYTGAEAMAVHVGADYAYYRKSGDADVRRIPESSSRRGSLALFPSLVNLDIQALAQTYDLYGDFTSEGGWRLQLVAKPESDVDYERIDLTGTAREVNGIDLYKSARSSIRIRMDAAEFPEAFSEAEVADYFFEPEAEHAMQP